MTTIDLRDIPNFLREANAPEWIEDYCQATDKVMKEFNLEYRTAIFEENLAWEDQMEGWTEKDSWIYVITIVIKKELSLDEEFEVIDKIGDEWDLIRPQRPDISYNVVCEGED